MLQNVVSHEEILPDSECFDQTLIRIGYTVSVFTWLITVNWYILVFPLFIHVYTSTSVKTCPLNVHPSCLFRPVHCLFRLVRCLTKYWNIQGRLVKWSSATDTNDYNQKSNQPQLSTNMYWAWGINEYDSKILPGDSWDKQRSNWKKCVCFMHQWTAKCSLEWITWSLNWPLYA